MRTPTRPNPPGRLPLLTWTHQTGTLQSGSGRSSTDTQVAMARRLEGEPAGRRQDICHHDARRAGKSAPQSRAETGTALILTVGMLQLSLLHAVILWTMSSRAVHDIIDHAYKGKRQEDDANHPFSVQPWGSDSDKRRYFLIEGRDDTAFRVYREGNPAGFTKRAWFSVAGSIDELKVLIGKLETVDKGPKARKLAAKLTSEIPRFEATEEVRGDQLGRRP